jgi:predicted O-methyltransferase YrrM
MLVQNQFQLDMQDLYAQYIKTISPMAPSMQTLRLLINLCVPGDRVLDLGSGFSSFVLRHYAESMSLEVWSVDDSTQWLDKTYEYCKQSGIPDSVNRNFMVWDAFVEMQSTANPFDVVFIDIGRTRKRPEYYQTILRDCCDARSLVLFDDMHKPILKRAAEKELRRYNYLDIPVIKDTRDQFGRYCKLVFRLRPRTEEG